MGKKTTEQPEPDFKNETSIEPAVTAGVDAKEARHLADLAAFAATQTRDMTLLCGDCKGRLERAHAEDERNRNAVYPEGVTP